jgi:hypothetical protein
LGGEVMTTTVPPPAYDHAYRGRLIVHVLPDSAASAACHGGDACSTRQGGTCIVILPRGHRALALLRRHEIGHCNGWPADHPGARTVTVP